MDIESYLLGKKAGGGGITPTGTIDITENGTYDVTNYASADVEVPSANLSDYFVNSATVLGQSCIKKFPFDIDLTGITNIQGYFAYFTNLGSITLKNATSVTNCSSCFNGCINLMTLDIRDMDFATITSASGFLGSGNNKVPTNCLIIVKDATNQQWMWDHYSNYTNVKRADQV